ncbi:MAG: nickel-dependent lactate racemase [Spirochaetota bacterium]
MAENSTEMTELQLPYGGSTLRYKLPRRNVAEVLIPNKVNAGLEQQDSLIEEALDNPIGTARLEEMVQPDQQVAIIIDDLTRPTPAARILPKVVKRLKKSGVADRQIEIIIALGTHRAMTKEEIQRKVGEEIAGVLRIENHDFHDTDTLSFAGDSHDGLPVWINRRVIEADFRIGIGNIVPHCVAGWAGGGKIIYPGVAGEKTVDAFHGAFGTDLANRVGNENAPIRKEIERLVEYVGLEYIVNTILTGEGIIYRVVAGDYRRAYRKGVEYARAVYAVQSRTMADIAVVSSYPADIDFWQAGKAVYSGELLVRDGGTLILVTPCPEGIVHNHDLLAYMSMEPDQLKKMLYNFQVEDRSAAAAALRLGLITRRIKVIVVSEGLTENDAQRLGFGYARYLQEAVNAALKAYGDNCKLSVLTHGGDIYPEKNRAI